VSALLSVSTCHTALLLQRHLLYGALPRTLVSPPVPTGWRDVAVDRNVPCRGRVVCSAAKRKKASASAEAAESDEPAPAKKKRGKKAKQEDPTGESTAQEKPTQKVKGKESKKAAVELQETEMMEFEGSDISEEVKSIEDDDDDDEDDDDENELKEEEKLAFEAAQQEEADSGDEDWEEGPAPQKAQRRYRRIQDEEILPPCTRFQGGRYGLQFFVGDLVEVILDGELEYARVARIPTDERPMDGSFIIKWDDTGEEWKCAYKDLRKPRRAANVSFPEWIEDWWPDEPPPHLADELKREWRWVSDKRPGTPGGGGMVPDAPDQGVYTQNRDDPYLPRPGQVLYGKTC